MHINIILGVRRSGTTALLTAFAQNDYVSAIYQPIQTACVYDGIDDPRRDVFTDISRLRHLRKFGSLKKHVVIKESIGIGLKGSRWDRIYRDGIFPSRSDIFDSKPLFVACNPYSCWASWKRIGWSFNCYLKSYTLAFDFFMYCYRISDTVRVVTFENLIRNREEIMIMLCHNWGIPFQKKMIYWEQRFTPELLGMHPESIRRNEEQNVFETLKEATEFGSFKQNETEISAHEKHIISECLEHRYCHLSEFSGHFWI